MVLLVTILFRYNKFLKSEGHAEYIAVIENTYKIQAINLVGSNNF
jgi:hypothetical protein